MLNEIGINTIEDGIGYLDSVIFGGLSLIAKAAVLKTASNRVKSGVWVGVPHPPQFV